MFVSFITPSRQVEFEFDNKEEIKVLMENWYHCNIVYPTYMALIDCIHTYERTNIQFTEQWNKQIEMDVMFKEDDWYVAAIVFLKYISIASIELIFLIRVGVLFLNFYSCIQVSKQQ